MCLRRLKPKVRYYTTVSGNCKMELQACWIIHFNSMSGRHVWIFNGKGKFSYHLRLSAWYVVHSSNITLTFALTIRITRFIAVYSTVREIIFIYFGHLSENKCACISFFTKKLFSRNQHGITHSCRRSPFVNTCMCETV